MATAQIAYSIGLFDYLVERALEDLGTGEVLFSDLDDSWIREAAGWSYTWAEALGELSCIEKQELACHVQQEVQEVLEEFEERERQMRWEFSLLSA